MRRSTRRARRPARSLPDRRSEDLGAYRAEIDQATGMLTVQLGVGIEEAFVRLRAYAYAQGRRLADVAADVVARRSASPRDSGDRIRPTRIPDAGADRGTCCTSRPSGGTSLNRGCPR